MEVMAAKIGSLSIMIGLGWAKSRPFRSGQCPVLSYTRQLMQAILHNKVQITKEVSSGFTVLNRHRSIRTDIRCLG